jgi:hypothetical protein
MNIKKLAILAGLLMGSLSGNALAQNPSIVVGDDSGAAGQQVTVPLTWDDGAATFRGVEFKVGFTDSILSFDSCVLNAPYDSYQLNVCQLNGSDVELGLIDNVLNPGTVPPGILGEVTFTIDPAAVAGTTPLIVNGVVLEGSPTVDTTNGEIQILGPTYSSSPAPGALNVGSAITGQANPETIVTISNIGAGILDVTCTDTTGMGSVFTVSPNTEINIAPGAPVGVTVSCDASSTPNTYNGTMSCSHNDPGSPAVYNLSCTITAGPQPAYTSDPVADSSINLAAASQGDPITPASVMITNSGDTGTTLVGTCSFGMAPPELSVADGDFSLAQGASETQFVSCDSSVAGTYNATLTCAHNGSNGPNATYPVECVVGDPRPAVYSSTPADGAIVEMTAGFVGGEAWVGATIPDQSLVITNTALAGAQDLDLSCRDVSPPQAGISVSPDLSVPFTLAPGDSTTATFSCGSATAGNYTLNYVCDWATEGEGIPQESGTANYTYNCDVREDESDVSTSPVSGSTITELAQAGGTTTFEVVFTENAGEGADGNIENCTLGDMDNFSILSPTLPDALIPSGGSTTVIVEGSDPGGVDVLQTTLNCTYTDSDSGGEGGPDTADFTLVMEIGGNGTFAVTKDFSDDNPDPVMVTLTCNTGIPLVQSFEITESTTVDFVVKDYESGAMDCSVTEEPVPGYATIYAASGDSASDNVGGCNFTAVASGDANACAITNIAGPGTFTLHKEWVVTEDNGEEVDREALMFIACDREILFVDVEFDPDYDGPLGDVEYIDFVSGPLFGNSSATAIVDTSNGPARCTGGELSELDQILQSGVEVTSDCPPFSNDGGETHTDPSTWLEVTSGGSAECTVTNTVFFEGIPTLSQWGMAIMALLMLGVGMVGFRRFT